MVTHVLEARSSEGLSPWLSLDQIQKPALLLSPPFGLSAEIPNNVWMEEQSPEERQVDLHLAVDQFHTLARVLGEKALTFFLPPYPGLQDLSYVANLGLIPAHIPDTVILSNFRSVPRRGEDIVGWNYFSQLGFKVVRAPYYFEGEADVKHLRDNIYIGGHGLRTSRKFLDWFADSFGARVLPFHIGDPRCYHLDGNVLPLSEFKVAACVENAEPEEIRMLENHAEIIPVSIRDAGTGATNCLVLGGELLCDSIIDRLSKSDARYEREKSKVVAIERMAAAANLQPRLIYLSEFEKSGACLSCLVMHMNWKQPTGEGDTLAQRLSAGA